MLSEAIPPVGGFVTGGGAVGALWAAVALVNAVRMKRNGNNSSQPGEGVVCREHGEALAAGKERFAHLQESVDRLHTKVDRLLEAK